MHALIVRNGVGKTTCLNAMVKAFLPNSEIDASFYTNETIFGRQQMNTNQYFGGLISVAFSAFDPFDPTLFSLSDNGDTQYSYIGLTDYSYDDDGQYGKRLKTDDILHKEFVDALVTCFAERDRKIRWEQAIITLQSDENFAAMGLLDLLHLNDDDLEDRALQRIRKMSSGHTIVLLSITLLVAKVNEKTLLLFDEPESHLQPPLLSAFIRSLGQLLIARNAVAIIATHSPVVLQEIPRSCVWKLYRSRLISEKKRPDTETFGENVGTLTREVFQLDVAKSGFHTVLSDLVNAGGSYDTIVEKLGGNLGYEARGILKAMILNYEEQNRQE